MTTRQAFAALRPLLTSIDDDAVAGKAEKFYHAAYSKTRPGSGNDLPGDLSNPTALAAVCLLIAQVQINGSSSVEEKDYSRAANLAPRHFADLLTRIRNVLQVATGISPFKSTPSRGGAKRKASVLQDEDTTPTKSLHGSSTRRSAGVSVVVPLRPGSAARAASSAARAQLASGSSSRKARVDEDMTDTATNTSQARQQVTPTKRSSARIAGETAPSKNTTPPTSNQKKLSSTTAFDTALRAQNITPQRTPVKKTVASTRNNHPTPASRSTKAGQAVSLEEVVEQKDYSVPYEAYKDDLLSMWRDAEKVRRRLEHDEKWRQEMLARVDEVLA